jgi:hypothetical protein
LTGPLLPDASIAVGTSSPANSWAILNAFTRSGSNAAANFAGRGGRDSSDGSSPEPISTGHERRRTR